MSLLGTPLLTKTAKPVGTAEANRFVDTLGAHVGAGLAAFGVNRTKALAGELADVITHGEAYVTSGAAVAVGDPIKSDANGKAIPQAGTQIILGRAKTAAAGADILVLVQLNVN